LENIVETREILEGNEKGGGGGISNRNILWYGKNI